MLLRFVRRRSVTGLSRRTPVYAELAVTSNFSFLRGASSPEELVRTAAILGLDGIGIADRNSVAGVVRVHVAAKQINEEIRQLNQKLATSEPELKIAIGTRLVFSDDTPDILAYPRDRAAWGRLTRLLSLGKRRAEKGDCILGLPDLLEFVEGLNLIVMPPARIHADRLHALLLRLKQAASKNAVWLAAGMLYRGDDLRRLKRIAGIAERRLCSADRRQRRALPCARAPGLAGCRHLHPRTSHAGSSRPAARSQCRAASQAAAGNGAVVSALSACGRRDGAFPRGLQILARRAARHRICR